MTLARRESRICSLVFEEPPTHRGRFAGHRMSSAVGSQSPFNQVAEKVDRILWSKRMVLTVKQQKC